MAAEPNPRRCFVQGKWLPKVFIAYPRKPTVYQTPIRPAGDNPDAWRQYDDELERLGRSDDAEVLAHEELVGEFADFLHTQSIAVAYDLIVRDIGALNVMRWYQTQITDSDYIILVVTPSLRPFLDGNFPLDKEPLFKSDYLYNIIHSRPKRPDGSPLDIIPVFLKSARNLDYIPTALEASSMYEVTDDVYRMPLSEGMTSLLCRLTGQDRYEPPPREKQIIIPPRRSRFGPRSSAPSGSTGATPPSLAQNHTPLNIRVLSRLAEKGEFSRHWKRIAMHLGLSEAEIERCEGKGGSDVNEACLQMLKLATDKGMPLTVAILSEAITKSGFYFLHSTLQSVIE